MYQVPCSKSESIISTLQLLAKTMEDELIEWNRTVFGARQRCYELNYFTTVQLLTLRRELGAVNTSSDTSCVPSNVILLLQSISSEVTSENVCDVVRDPCSSVGSTVLEQSTSGTIERSVNMCTPISVDSVNDEVVIQKPTLKEDELTDEQKGVMAFVVQRLNCPKLLVLKGFEVNHGKVMNRYDYKKWCSDNLAVYKDYEDDDASISEDDSVSQQSSDETDFGNPMEFSCLSGNTII